MKSTNHNILAAVDIAASAPAADGSPRLPTFSMVAYTGSEILQWSWDKGEFRAVIDLSGLDLSAKGRPIFMGHDYTQIVGHTSSVGVEAGNVVASGTISGTGPAAQEVVDTARNGFPWQASVGVAVGSWEEVKAGQSVRVNGRDFAGPLMVARTSRLKEISFVPLGADDATSASVAAKAVGGLNMADVETAAPAADVAASSASTGAAIVTEMRAKAAAEANRLAEIAAVCAGRPEIQAKAIAEGWSKDKATIAVQELQLSELRASRPAAPNVNTGAPSGAMETDILAAAVCRTLKLPGNAGMPLDPKAVEAADKEFPRGIGLQELLIECAAKAGYRQRWSHGSNLKDFISAAFSNADVANIITAVGNKAMAAGFGQSEQAWREVAAIRPVKDFKTVTSYRLVGDHVFEKLVPGGTVKHGTLKEESYSNAADTYAKLIHITRRDIINDDLGVLSDLPMKLGRGAGQKLNEVFWTAWLANAGSFFGSGNSNYYSTSAALSVTTLQAVEALFLNQLDDQSKPVGLKPSILLVPPQLSATAKQLYTSTEIRDPSTSGAKYGTTNTFQGMYKPVVSAWLPLASITGYSATAFYLLASPADMPVAEVAFLNGNDMPTIETVDPDADNLGVVIRGYYDFGCTLANYRGGVKAVGA